MAKKMNTPAEQGPDFDALAESVLARGEEKRKAKAERRKSRATVARALAAVPRGATWAEATRAVLNSRGFEAPGLDAMTDDELGELLRVGRRVAWLLGRDGLRGEGGEK